jgi:hypothetical protein
VFPLPPGGAVTGDPEKSRVRFGGRRITFNPPWEKQMKIRAVVILVFAKKNHVMLTAKARALMFGLVISFAPVAFPQEKEEVNPFPFGLLPRVPN